MGKYAFRQNNRRPLAHTPASNAAVHSHNIYSSSRRWPLESTIKQTAIVNVWLLKWVVAQINRLPMLIQQLSSCGCWHTHIVSVKPAHTANQLRNHCRPADEENAEDCPPSRPFMTLEGMLSKFLRKGKAGAVSRPDTTGGRLLLGRRSLARARSEKLLVFWVIRFRRIKNRDQSAYFSVVARNGSSACDYIHYASDADWRSLYRSSVWFARLA